MNTVILLKKPEGMTSFDAVASCRRILHEKKIGHTGTLDPNASGLLIILTGSCTKLLPYCIKNHKHYQATFLLGQKTDTQDIWGTVLERREPSVHDPEILQKQADLMLGDSSQIPPMYSAVKMNGKKLYELARKGKTVERQPRPIHVSSLRIGSAGDNAYTMDAVVSSGTYIRTLIEDLAAGIGELACMSSLVRIGIENVSLDDACTLEELADHVPEIPPERIIDPEIERVQTDALREIRDGKDIVLSSAADQVLLMKDQEILAVYRRADGSRYHCERGIASL